MSICTSWLLDPLLGAIAANAHHLHDPYGYYFLCTLSWEIRKDKCPDGAEARGRQAGASSANCVPKHSSFRNLRFSNWFPRPNVTFNPNDRALAQAEETGQSWRQHTSLINWWGIRVSPGPLLKGVQWFFLKRGKKLNLLPNDLQRKQSHLIYPLLVVPRIS